VTELITKFEGDTAWLSNFYVAPIQIDGWHYPTVEHAFQAAKTLDPDQKQAIAEASGPGQAKRLGRQAALRRDWEQVKVPTMAQLLLVKFTQHVRLGRMLGELDGVHLVEGNNWHDQFWGDCYCSRHRAEPGRNKLGKLLMELAPRMAARYYDEREEPHV